MTILDPCLSNPCRYGRCLATNVGSYRCQCLAEFTGNHCQLITQSMVLLINFMGKQILSPVNNNDFS